MAQVLLADESAESRSLPLSAQRLVNLFTEQQRPDSKSQVPLFGAPGLTAFVQNGNGPVRGYWVMQGVLYAVSGTSLYSISASGEGTLIGTGISGSNVVSMADNGSQLVIVNGNAGWIYLSGGGSSALASNAVAGAGSIMVNTVTGFTVGEPITITLDTTGTFDTTIASISGLTIGLSGTLPSQASTGNTVSSTTSSFTQIMDPNFHGANTVEFFDGYFVYDWPGTNQFYLSGLLDGTSYNGLDFASAEASPDFLIATIQNLQLLFLFCTAHIELWYDAGAADFPFQRYAGGVINYGCISPYTIIKQDGAIFFLGVDKIMYRLQANVPIRISTHEMEHIIVQDPDITSASCFTFVLEGHKMIVLTLAASNRTLVFDISTNKWHERESWDENNISLGRWRGNCAIEAYGKTYIGDAFNGMTSLLDWTVYTELGNTIRGLVHSAPVHFDRQRIFISRAELDVETGVGLVSGQGSDPQIMLRYSQDGARTWSKLQPWRSMGKIGSYLQRLRWLRMGVAYQWVFEITITDPVKRTIIAFHVDREVGL